MKYIELSSGKRAIVDDEDFERVSQYKWSFHKIGYAFRNCGPKAVRKAQYLHRFLLDEPAGIVDHINGDGLDNRRANLRVVDKSGNGLNRHKLDRRNTSGATGVSWSKEKRLWYARIKVRGHVRALGYFRDKEAAIAARRAAEAELAFTNP